jgi:hypothetical protein
MMSRNQHAAGTRELPRWIGIAIVSVIAVGSGWWLWSYYRDQPNASELTEVMPPRGPRGWMQVPRDEADGVRQRQNGSYQIKAGEAMMTASRTKTGDDWNLQLSYVKPDLLTTEQAAALLARYRLVSDAAFAKSLKVTDEQLKQLRKVPTGTRMVLTDVDQKRIEGLWDAYVRTTGPKATAEKSVVDALREIAASSLAPTRASVAERSERVRAILTPEQISPFKQ